MDRLKKQFNWCWKSDTNNQPFQKSLISQ